jgi:hypothetical protein
MIKSLIILALVLVLAGGAFLSRPKPADFKPFIQQKLSATQGQGNILKDALADMQTKNYLDHCTFKDRLLWMTVFKDDKPAFVGAFSHWFTCGDGGGTTTETTTTTTTPKSPAPDDAPAPAKHKKSHTPA